MKGKFLLLSVFAVLLLSCDALPTEQTGINRFQAQILADLLLDADAYLVATMSQPTMFTSLFGFDPDLAQGMVLPNTVDCVNETFPSVDLDNDGIPADFRYMVDCAIINDNDGSSLSLSGGSRVRDADDGDPLSGYSIDVDEFKLSAINAQQQESYLLLDIDVSVDRQGHGYTVSYNFKIASKGVNSLEQAMHYAYATAYTPDDTSNPFVAGTFQYAGQLSFQGQERTYQLNAVADDLHYRNTCALGFDGGERSYRDSANNELIITYNACGDTSINFNGFKL